MTKINKTLTEDVFKGMKHVDSAFNKAAGINESVEDSFEVSLKKRLLKESSEPFMDNDDNEVLEMRNNPENAIEEANDEYAFLDGEDEDENEEVRNWEDELVPERFPMDNEDEFEFEPEVEELEEYGNEHEMSVNDALGDNELDEVLFNEATMNEANPFEGGAEEMPMADETAPTEEMPAEGEVPAEGEMPIEGEEGLDTSMDEVPGMDAPMSAPSMGGERMPAETGAEDAAGAPEEVMPSTTLSQPEDIDQLIADIVPAEETFTENKELKDLGYKDLETQELTNKVKMESKKSNKKVVTEASIESKPLENKYGTPSRVKGSIESKKVEHSGKVQPKALTDLGFTVLDEEEINSNTVNKTATQSAVKVETDPKFTKVVAESKDKSKALVKLAEKYVALEDENKKLQFENYKLKSANSVLVLLPEASEKTRTKLVQRFSECKTSKEVKAFYEEVASMAKSENNKTKKLNEVVSKRSSAIRSINESVNTTDNDTETDVEQERKNFLMGVSDSDMYNKGIKY